MLAYPQCRTVDAGWRVSAVDPLWNPFALPGVPNRPGAASAQACGIGAPVHENGRRASDGLQAFDQSPATFAHPRRSLRLERLQGRGLRFIESLCRESSEPSQAADRAASERTPSS